MQNVRAKIGLAGHLNRRPSSCYFVPCLESGLKLNEYPTLADLSGCNYVFHK